MKKVAKKNNKGKNQKGSKMEIEDEYKTKKTKTNKRKKINEEEES